LDAAIHVKKKKVQMKKKYFLLFDIFLAIFALYLFFYTAHPLCLKKVISTPFFYKTSM
jgi:hypothetical protein